MRAREIGPGKFALSFVPNPSNLDKIKNKGEERFPGTSFLRESKKWVTNRYRVQELGLVDYSPSASQVPVPDTFEEHQRSAWDRLLSERAMILSWVTGAGKSYFATQAIKHLGKKVLCVAPKMVLQSLAKEFRKIDIEPKIIGSTLKAEREAESFVTLVSYGSLHKVEKTGWNMVVADELHYTMNQKSTRTAKLREIIDNLPVDAYVLGLTATPFGAKTTAIWSQLDCIIPGAFGTRYQWEQYFHEIGEKDLPTGEVVRVVGRVRKDRMDEYCDYIYQFLDYVDVSKFSHLLPDSTWKMKWLDGDYRVAPSSLGSWAKTQHKLSDDRVRQLPKPVGPTAYICYLKSTADKASEALGIPCITGRMTPKKRMETLDDCDAFVATMHSITEGLNLGRFTTVYVVEGYPVVRYVSQVLGRFLRLKGTETINYTLLPMEHTADELIYPRLLDRLKEQNEILKSGAVQSKLSDLLLDDEEDDSFMEELRDAIMAGEWIEEEDE